MKSVHHEAHEEHEEHEEHEGKHTGLENLTSWQAVYYFLLLLVTCLFVMNFMRFMVQAFTNDRGCC